MEEEIIDNASHKKYLALKKELYESPDRYYQLSTEDFKIDLFATVSILQKQCKNKKVPDEEFDIILEKASVFRVKLGDLAALKKKALAKKINLEVLDDGRYISKIEVKRAEILGLFGKMFSVTEVHKVLVTDWGLKDVSYNELLAYYKRNIDRITELQNDYKNKTNEDFRLGFKRSRLEELTWLYNINKDEILKYQSIERTKVLQSLLESIKKEIEGDLVINGKFQVDIEETINFKVQQDLIKDFPLGVIILAKLAGKRNINPMVLLSRLANSHYSKFTGFRTPTNSMHTDEIDYPSALIYNIDDLEKKNAEITKKDEELGQLQEIPEEKVEVLLSLKDRILQDIRNRTKGGE